MRYRCVTLMRVNWGGRGGVLELKIKNKESFFENHCDR